jgi:hypothetical protein
MASTIGDSIASEMRAKSHALPNATTIDTAALRAAFERLREAWWVTHLRLEADPLLSFNETDDCVRRRVEANERTKREYDRQTLAIICGDTSLPVAPMTQDTVLRAAKPT